MTVRGVSTRHPTSHLRPATLNKSTGHRTMQSFINAAPARIAGRPWRPVRVDGVVFSPQRGQRRWVRDRVAAIWHAPSRRWVAFQRVQPAARFPFDNRPCQWQAMGGAACFPSIAAAAAWVQSLPQM